MRVRAGGRESVAHDPDVGVATVALLPPSLPAHTTSAPLLSAPAELSFFFFLHMRDINSSFSLFIYTFVRIWDSY